MAALYCPRCESDRFRVHARRVVQRTETETRIVMLNTSEAPWGDNGDETYDAQDNDHIMEHRPGSISAEDEEHYENDTEDVTVLETGFFRVDCHECSFEFSDEDIQQLDLSDVTYYLTFSDE